MATHTEKPPPAHSRSFFQTLALVCCLPVLVIAIALLTAGGTSFGLLVPALVAGAVIGMLMFMTLGDRPRE